MKRIGIKYFPEITKQLKPIYRTHNIELVHRNDSSLKNALGSIKDVPPDIHKSGIYRIACSHCGIAYYGQSVRKLFVRFKEHIQSAHWKTKTSVGKHISESGHVINISDLTLVQEVRQTWKLELYEAIHIKKNSHMTLMNADDGNVNSRLLKLFATKRTVDQNIIDLTNETLNESINEEFFDCESSTGESEWVTYSESERTLTLLTIFDF